MKALQMAVVENAELVPPCGEGALYLRPILFGSGPQLGIGPSPAYTFLTYGSPVGEYFKGVVGGARMKIERGHSRAAPKGIFVIVSEGSNFFPRSSVTRRCGPCRVPASITHEHRIRVGRTTYNHKWLLAIFSLPFFLRRTNSMCGPCAGRMWDWLCGLDGLHPV